MSWAQAKAHGETEGSVRAHLRAGRWTRVRHGAYLVHGVTAVRDAWVQARAVALTIPGVVIAGPSAAELWGVAGAPGGAVEVAVPPGRSLRSRSDLVVHRTTVERSEVVPVRGLLVTSPARTVQDVVPAHDRLVGLAVLDSALRAGRLQAGDLARFRDGCRGRPGAAATRDLWAYADGRAAHGGADAAYRDRGRANDITGLGHDILRFSFRDTVTALAIPRAIHAAL